MLAKNIRFQAARVTKKQTSGSNATTKPGDTEVARARIVL